ncbi:histidine phosphatase family protein [Paracoccus alkanivorans]|uniref:Histidine phosphatase family protein n=1 Tax=Paracoccus alkanivorans TaxID=2116655 RepID=A0A3M0MPF6_9RHOB|nr:histidine phosphatase family protein [Paracoccus alkanivorans]RMC37600.1 histidine phosphatase family protein [Paracoccus alkanivorans]
MSNEVRQSRFTPPPGAADLLLIRHGESMPAIRGESFPLKDGHGDPALHPEGEAQARAVCARLQADDIADIYVTTLRRTRQTAAPLAAALGIDPKVEPDLREVHLGDWDGGLYRFRAAERHPAFERARERHEWGEIPGAETTAALHRRVGAALLRIAGAHPDARVAVFVHGGVIGAAMSIATGARPFAFNGAANGSMTQLVIRGETMIVGRFNDTAHLE